MPVYMIILLVPMLSTLLYTYIFYSCLYKTKTPMPIRHEGKRYCIRLKVY